MKRKTMHNSWKMVILSSLIFLGFMVVILPTVAAYSARVIGVSESPDLSFKPASMDLYALAGAYGDTGRRTYINLRWTFDLVWPMVYTWFLFSWLFKLSNQLKIEGKLGKLYLLPFVGMGFDYLENIGATLVMWLYPMKLTGVTTLTPYISLCKWMTIGAGFVVWGVLLVLWLAQLLRNKIGDRHQS